jgi:membrane protein
MREHRRQRIWLVLKAAGKQWMDDKCPQIGAALAFFAVFSLAPLILILLGIFGLLFGAENARDKIVEQLQHLVDPSAIKVIKEIAANVAHSGNSHLATALGIIVGLFGASGVFVQLQDALNTIWGVKAKPEGGIWAFVAARILSFVMVAAVCGLLLVSVTIESVLTTLGGYVQSRLPEGHLLILLLFRLLDIGTVIVPFALIFRYLPDIKTGWRDVWVGALLTGVLFIAGKFFLGVYFASGAAGSAYGAASSLITLLLWIYYSAQILLFGAEFTQLYSSNRGSQGEPQKYAVRVERMEIEHSRPEIGDDLQAGGKDRL